MARTHTLKGLRVNEVSLVDAPANPGAYAVLFKRKEPAMPAALDKLLLKLGIRKTAGPAEVDPAAYIEDAEALLKTATTALHTSIQSILSDGAVTDKTEAVGKSLQEFNDYLDQQLPDQITKAMRDVALAGGADGFTHQGAGDDTMPTIEDLTKQLNHAVSEIAILKMSPAHSQYCADMNMDDDAKAAFAAKTPDERETHMAANPVKKAPPTLPPEVQKALDESTDLRKRLATLENEREMLLTRKRAIDVGLSEADAETIIKARGGDSAAIDVLLDKIKASQAQVAKSQLFGEFGSARGAAPGTAAAEVQAQAEAMRKSDGKLSLLDARLMVRKTDPDLAQRERDEERAASRAAS